ASGTYTGCPGCARGASTIASTERHPPITGRYGRTRESAEETASRPRWVARRSAPEDVLQQDERVAPREIVRERVVANALEVQDRRIRVGETVDGGAEDRDLVVPHPGVQHLLAEVVDVFKGCIRIPGATICNDVSPD